MWLWAVFKHAMSIEPFYFTVIVSYFVNGLKVQLLDMCRSTHSSNVLSMLFVPFLLRKLRILWSLFIFMIIECLGNPTTFAVIQNVVNFTLIYFGQRGINGWCKGVDLVLLSRIVKIEIRTTFTAEIPVTLSICTWWYFNTNVSIQKSRKNLRTQKSSFVCRCMRGIP